MKKIYLFLVMCSLSIAGFASGALQAGSLRIGGQPGCLGSPAVVRQSTIQNGVVPTGVSSGHSHNALFARIIRYRYSNGWIAKNNMDATTVNNTPGVVPGAGFLIASADRTPVAAEAQMVNGTAAASARFFAFGCKMAKQAEGSGKVPGASAYCGLLKPVIYV